MAWTISPQQILEAAWSTLVLRGSRYVKVSEGYRDVGSRPEGDWHGHGHFARWLWTFDGGIPRRVTVHKRRWRLKGSNETCHSRLPCEVGGRKVTMLVLVLLLWTWLDGVGGLHYKRQAHDEVLDVVCRRTVQRYLRVLQPHALTFQQLVREAVIERSEPWPVEHLFPRGLSPPARLYHLSWPHPNKVRQLWTAIGFVLGASLKLQITAAVLLAEARGRNKHQKHP